MDDERTDEAVEWLRSQLSALRGEGRYMQREVPDIIEELFARYPEMLDPRLACTLLWGEDEQRWGALVNYADDGW
ncbi:hypothetical protein [Methylobacterium sp. 1973]|uniref:hypothetical protein n=1 Tax=Methylobacterium sp. 1973 TaxID=3156421 RepID=UPI00339147EA